MTGYIPGSTVGYSATAYLYSLITCISSLACPCSPMGEYDVTAVQNTDKDNSSLFDRNTSNQTLGHGEIEALKKSGKVSLS